MREAMRPNLEEHLTQWFSGLGIETRQVKNSAREIEEIHRQELKHLLDEIAAALPEKYADRIEGQGTAAAHMRGHDEALNQAKQAINTIKERYGLMSDTDQNEREYLEGLRQEDRDAYSLAVGETPDPLEQILLEVFETGYQQGLAGQTGAVKLMLSNNAQYRIRQWICEGITEDESWEPSEPTDGLWEDARNKLRQEIRNNLGL